MTARATGLSGDGQGGKLQEFTRPGYDPDVSPVVLSETPGGPGRVNNDAGSSRRGLFVTAKPYFKIWAAEALLSDDFDALRDQERSIWLLLMCVASLETPRWETKITPRLAEKCKTTEKKLLACVKRLAELGMISVDGDRICFETAAKWNEETDGRKKPSDSPEATRARKAASRAGNVTPPVTPPVTRDSHAHKEEEEDKEKEEEEEIGVTSSVREMRDHVLSKLPLKFARDPEVVDEAQLFAEDYAGMWRELNEAHAQVKRQQNGKTVPFPGSLRKFMPSVVGAMVEQEPKPFELPEPWRDHVVLSPEEQAKQAEDARTSLAERQARQAAGAAKRE